MALQVFSFIDEVSAALEEWNEELEIATRDLAVYLESLLIENNEGYLNINSRVKSPSSLKEKIVRNNYYKQYESPEELFSNLSDLIGIRIECRFIEDENNIYKTLKKYFNKVYDDGLYYNASNINIRLDLKGKQPQKQKNGFKIYRIDGVYEFNDKVINFELQIKALVNIFWGEIEHKIIYKNYNYMIVDKFFKEMMSSIKNNLAMIDNQLLIIYNQFNKMNSIDSEVRKQQMEAVLSKIIYDIFSTRIKNNLGFIMDFRKSCDIIMEYILRSSNVQDLDDYNSALINTLNRLNDISKNQIDFDSEIIFERDVILNDEFSKIVGSTMLKSINTDFHWNLFFRILFEIELGNNAEDFESFIKFFKNRFYNNKSFLELHLIFNEEEYGDIINSLMLTIAYAFDEIDSINFIHEKSIKEINEIIENLVFELCKNVHSYDEWLSMKRIYLELFYIKIVSLFDLEIDTSRIMKVIEEIKGCSPSEEIREDVLKYIDKLQKLDKIKVNEVVTLLKAL